MKKLYIKRMDKSIELPKYAYEDDAAFDLRAAKDVLIKPGEKALIPTSLKFIIPQGCVGLIWDRSGLAARNSLHCLAGVIDSHYRGETKVVMINLGKEEFKVEKGMRIAQMLIQNYEHVDIEEIEEIKEDTERATGGFGSTGLH
jgi:dUTP pyrophosphatase